MNALEQVNAARQAKQAAYDELLIELAAGKERNDIDAIVSTIGKTQEQFAVDLRKALRSHCAEQAVAKRAAAEAELEAIALERGTLAADEANAKREFLKRARELNERQAAAQEIVEAAKRGAEYLARGY